MPDALKERKVGSVVVLEVSGRLTITGEATALTEKLQSLIAAGQKALLVDCSGVTEIDSQGVSAIVRCQITATKRGGNLKLLKISPRVRHVLISTRLLTVIDAYDDEAEALESFKS